MSVKTSAPGKPKKTPKTAERRLKKPAVKKTAAKRMTLSEIAMAGNLPEDAPLSEILAVIPTLPTPVKMSKIAEWWMKHPNGLEIVYIDWKALGLDHRPASWPRKRPNLKAVMK